ncbi:DegT/DnrJ/EryC1/StrS family aminotransferase [Bradyrhizobium sp. TZ2]
MKVPFYRHDLNVDDVAAVGQVINSPFLTSGPVGKRVEAMLTDYFGLPHAILANSWTNGAVALLLAMGISPGDEVIVPAMTFVATANVVELVGAKPVFVDVDCTTLLLTPEAVEAALTERTRAVIPVHLYGQMCDMRGMRQVLSGRPDIYLIEDAAHCFEGTRDGYRPGAHSDAAVFSFYATKNVACGEGGAIICSDADLYEKLMQTRLHGMDAAAINRYQKDSYRHWDMIRLGTKANLPDLLAALLPRQIECVDERLVVRKQIVARYRDAFADGPLWLQADVSEAMSAEHMFTINCGAARDEAIARLSQAGIGVGVHYRPPAQSAFYKNRYGFRPEDHPISTAWGNGTLTLPLYAGLTQQEQQHVIDIVKGEVYPLASMERV